ncbi:MAG: HAD family hydrolase [Microbacteriaceae bacterium]|nr:HAD family hydrolase [Microbacteriaceae bacterium]
MGELCAVGFDLDGTLFDHHGSARVAVDDFLRGLGVAPSAEARRAWFEAEEKQFERWRVGQISFQEQRRQRLRLVLPALGVPAPSAPAELDELFTVYLGAYRAAWRAFPDSLELLRSLRSCGFRVGILTNGTEDQQVDKLEVVGLAEEIDVVCISERIGAQKPEPLAFATLARELGVTPDQCLFVGDNAEQDVAGALAAGMSALLVDRSGAHADGISAAVRAALTGR